MWASLARIIQLKFSFFAVVILVQLLLVSMAVIFVGIAIDLQQKADGDRAFGIATFVNKQIDAANDEAVAATLALNEDAPLASALAARNRVRLDEIAQPIWKKLEGRGFRQFGFDVQGDDGTDPTTFYRAQNPNLFNDSAAIRPGVVKADGDPKVGVRA